LARDLLVFGIAVAHSDHPSLILRVVDVGAMHLSCAAGERSSGQPLTECDSDRRRRSGSRHGWVAHRA
jgi:hypothetical protein